MDLKSRSPALPSRKQGQATRREGERIRFLCTHGAQCEWTGDPATHGPRRQRRRTWEKVSPGPSQQGPPWSGPWPRCPKGWMSDSEIPQVPRLRAPATPGTCSPRGPSGARVRLCVPLATPRKARLGLTKKTPREIQPRGKPILPECIKITVCKISICPS